MGGDRPLWQDLLMTAVSLAAVGAMLWMEAPGWQRDQIRQTVRSRVAGAAWQTGRHAMSLEIEHGRPGPGYQLTYWLSRLRDAISL